MRKPDLNHVDAVILGHGADAAVTAFGIAHSKGNYLEGNGLLRKVAWEAAYPIMLAGEPGAWAVGGIAVGAVKLAAVAAVAALLVVGADYLEDVPYSAAFVYLLAAVGAVAAVTNVGVMFA